MKKQIIAIGGGGFGRTPGEGLIEKYILDQSEKDVPNICFIPTATGDNEAYKVNYYSTFSKLDCSPSHLDFFKRTPDLKELILKQDVIFVGGGNTKSMLAVWKDWGLDLLLKEAYEKGVIMSGVSAGAICWFDQGITDSWAEDLKVMDCLGFIEGACCPHYDEEPQRKPSLNKFITEKVLKSCYAVDGGCALHIEDEKEFKSVVFSENKNSFLVEMKDNKVAEKPYSTIDIY
jgi:aminopeptidase N|tara:strand:- start:860 stop:1555 length:696 start_codon:yes stop_codon:yes gene_type:complete